MMYDDKTTCADVLAEWDKGGTVWSIEMGGLGPGYEQAIQVLAMECLLELETVGFEWTDDRQVDSDRCRSLLDPVVSRVDKWPGMGFSGAQVGAAMQIAAMLHRHGPRAAIDKAGSYRWIQVSKTWPHEPTRVA